MDRNSLLIARYLGYGALMQAPQFNVSPHNAHYEGDYSAQSLEWRRICAVDKTRNLQSLLGDRKVARVLDVGCGTGSVLSAIAASGIGVEHVGVDTTDPEAHRDRSAIGMDLRQYDGKTLPFETGVLTW